MNKIWIFSGKAIWHAGAERNFEEECRQGVRLPCRGGAGAGQYVHLRRWLFSLRRQDQGSRNLPSTCSPQAEGNCAPTVLHIVLVRQVQPHRRVVVLAGGVGRSPFPPWGLGGLLRRRRYNIRPSRKLISKRKAAAAAAQDATERMLVGSSNHWGQWLWSGGVVAHTARTRLYWWVWGHHRMKRGGGNKQFVGSKFNLLFCSKKSILIQKICLKINLKIW